MKIGFAAADVTPDSSLFLTGYGNPERIATGVHSPLYASIMVMGDGSKTAAVISMDWCTIDEKLTWEIRNGIEEISGIKAEDIIFCCTHTHSAPHTRRGSSKGRTACDPDRNSESESGPEGSRSFSDQQGTDRHRNETDVYQSHDRNQQKQELFLPHHRENIGDGEEGGS